MRASCAFLAGMSFLFLGACATSLEVLEKNLNALKGTHIDRLIKKIGEPDEQKFPSGKKFYVWKWDKIEEVEYCDQIWDYEEKVGVKIPVLIYEFCRPEKVKYHCIITVEVDEADTIISPQFKGNVGGCKKFARPFAKSR